MNQNLIKKFETELNNRIKLKETQIKSRNLVLLNAFKYFDYQHSGFVDLSKFKKVLKIKLNINIFNDSDLNSIYMHYINKLVSNDKIDYREFADYIKSSKNKMPKDNFLKKKNNFIQKDKERMIKTKNTFSSNTSSPKIDKILENIFYKLRKENLSIFFELFKEIKKYDVDNLGLILVDDFLKVFKNLDITIHKNDLNDIGEYFIEKQNLMDYDKLFKCFFLNFNGFRAAQINFMFGRIDYKENEKININILKEIFEPRQYYNVRTGRRTPKEIKKAFCYSIDIFRDFYHKEIDIYEFTIFFKYLSAYFEEDMHYKNFILESFKYNKIIKLSKQLEKYENEKLLNPVYSDKNPKKLISFFIQQVSKKKNGFINLLRSFKTVDYGRENYLYYNEFKKALSYQRIVLKDEHLKIIFKLFSNKTYKLDFWKMLESLIPTFKKYKIDALESLYNDLLKNNNINKLQYFTFQNSFNAKSHPDFKNCIKPDYMLKNEFADSLKVFLDNYKSFDNYISFETFVRFFEYFARDWSDEYFKNILSNCFSKNKRDVNLKISSKKNPNISLSSKRKSLYNNSTISRSSKTKTRHWDKNSELSKTSKIKSHRSIKNSRKSGINLKNKKSEIHIKDNQDYLKYNPNAFKKQKKDYEKNSYRKKLQEENRRNIEIRNKSILSPDNRSYLSYEPNEHSAYILNKKIQNSIVRKEDRIYDNIHKEHDLDKNPFSVFKNQIYKSLKYNILLELEYELTIKSDNKGSIDYQNFNQILKKLNLVKNLKEDNIHSIFSSFCENRKLHVQAFSNELRGQMNEEREYKTMDLFERFCDGQDFIEVDYLRRCFKPEKIFRSSKDSLDDVQEMFQFMIDLFYCLNLEIKNRTYFDLDDFLYFFDNFSFFCGKNSEFNEIINKCF